MANTNYIYGTKPDTDKHVEIKVIRNIASKFINDPDCVFISKHAFSQMGQRNISLTESINVIAEGFFVEYQPVPDTKKNRFGFFDATVFYSGHESQICSVNSVADLSKEIITLITVEHMDDDKWDICDDYVVRKENI